VVSHDRYFLERTTDRIAALYGDGRVRLLPGGVDEYLEYREKHAAQVSESRTTKAPAQQSNQSTAGSGSREQRAVKKELARIERRLDKIAELEAALHEELSRIGGDYLAAAEADAKLRELHEERLRLEDEWLSLSE
jgi:ATP-binding cassette subfamily F protein uup